MNFSNITSTLSPSTFPADCPGDPLLWNEDYLVEKSLFILLGIVLSVASCPFIVLLNVLVIVAVKTRHGLQTMHNILLACMAGTDLLVGAVVQPSFIVAEIFALNGLSPDDHCRFFKLALRPFFIPFSASLFHLALLSAERFVAMKFTLRYKNIVTTTRIKSAIIFVWLFSVGSAIPFFSDFDTLKNTVRLTYFIFRVFALVIIVYCHISVYVVTRRHEKQILAEQVSPQAAAKFLKEKKALRTTTLIIGVLFMCYFPLFMPGIFKKLLSTGYFVNLITLAQPVYLSVALLNSLCNPLIYCCRNKMFRKAFIELL